MGNVDYKSVVKCISTLFNINLNDKTGESELFSRLKSVIDYDFAGIYFLNPESAQLKYTSSDNSEIA